jgi:hypothetical protein
LREVAGNVAMPRVALALIKTFCRHSPLSFFHAARRTTLFFAIASAGLIKREEAVVDFEA